MKLPRDLSGAELIKLLCKHHGYRQVNRAAGMGCVAAIEAEWFFA
jgi:hypothetical protein